MEGERASRRAREREAAVTKVLRETEGVIYKVQDLGLGFLRVLYGFQAFRPPFHGAQFIINYFLFFRQVFRTFH
jgi:hypothetical protein